jgi:hypothetical protein
MYRSQAAEDPAQQTHKRVSFLSEPKRDLGQLLHNGIQAVFAARQHRHNGAIVAQTQRHSAADAG